MTALKVDGQNNYWKRPENKNHFGFDPKLKSYRVASGDYLGKISEKIKREVIAFSHVSTPELIKMLQDKNNIPNADLIHVGQILKLPELGPEMTKVEQVQPLSNKKSLPVLEGKRRDYFKGKLKRFLKNHPTLKQKEVLAILSQLNFAGTFTTVTIKKGSSLTIALKKLISEGQNNFNKDKWENALTILSLKSQSDLKELQLVYVNYKLYQWVKAGFDIDCIQAGTSLSISENGKFKINPVKKDPILLGDLSVKNIVVREKIVKKSAFEALPAPKMPSVKLAKYKRQYAPIMGTNSVDDKILFVKKNIQDGTEHEVVRTLLFFSRENLLEEDDVMSIILSLNENEGLSVWDDPNDYLSVVLFSLDKNEDINDLVSIIREATNSKFANINKDKIRKYLVDLQGDRKILVALNHNEDLQTYWRTT